jgi:hypothetical protein
VASRPLPRPLEQPSEILPALYVGGRLSSRLLLEEGRQLHADEIREQLPALRLGQRRHAVHDGAAARKMRRSTWAASIASACPSSRVVSSSSRTLAVMTR